MVFCAHLILYFVLALGISSWHPLVSMVLRFFGVVSFIFAAIYLSFAYWFYTAEKPSMATKIGAILVTTALLAVPGFFLIVIGGFPSADHSFSGLPVEATIIFAFIAAVVIDSCILLLYRAAAIPPEICLANQLGYERF